jgi:DNA polymerase V
MINAGIFDGDILVVDKSLKPLPGKVVIAAIDGQLTVKRLQQNSMGGFILLPENPKYQPTIINNENEVVIWGVVTCVLHTP